MTTVRTCVLERRTVLGSTTGMEIRAWLQVSGEWLSVLWWRILQAVMVIWVSIIIMVLIVNCREWIDGEYFSHGGVGMVFASSRGKWARQRNRGGLEVISDDGKGESLLGFRCAEQKRSMGARWWFCNLHKAAMEEHGLKARKGTSNCWGISCVSLELSCDCDIQIAESCP